MWSDPTTKVGLWSRCSQRFGKGNQPEGVISIVKGDRCSERSQSGSTQSFERRTTDLILVDVEPTLRKVVRREGSRRKFCTVCVLRTGRVSCWVSSYFYCFTPPVFCDSFLQGSSWPLPDSSVLSQLLVPIAQGSLLVLLLLDLTFVFDIWCHNVSVCVWERDTLFSLTFLTSAFPLVQSSLIVFLNSSPWNYHMNSNAHKVPIPIFS